MTTLTAPHQRKSAAVAAPAAPAAPPPDDAHSYWAARRRPGQPRVGRASSLNPSLSLTADLPILLLLTALALATRLHDIRLPAAVVFDEFHFGKFVNGYFTGQYFFDIHPPLGKLVLFAAGKLAGNYDPTFPYANIHQEFPNDGYVAPRAAAAVLGALVVPTMYLIPRALGLSVAASLLPAVTALLDLLLLLESRLILTDSQVMLYSALCLLCALHLWATNPKTQPLRRVVFLAATAVFGAAGIATKWTAAVTPLFVAMGSILGETMFPGAYRLGVLECAAAALIAAVEYAAVHYVHFKLLPLAGPGDRFMTKGFRRTLQPTRLFPNPLYDPSDPSGHKYPFFWKLAELTNTMYRANAGISKRHHWESKWWEWPLNLRGISYYVKHSSPQVLKYVYLIANPVITPLVLLTLAVFVALFINHSIYIARLGKSAPPIQRNIPKRLAKKAAAVDPPQITELHSPARLQIDLAVRRGIICVLAYVVNLVPYIGIQRPTFLYHYLPALMYAEILMGVVLEAVVPGTKGRLAVVAVATAGLTAAFMHWAPWVYASDVTLAYLEKMRWMPRWN